MEVLTGIIVSILTQIAKKYGNTGEYVTLGVVAVLSLLGAWAYSYLVHAGYWPAVLSVLTTAGAFYTFILARLPNTSSGQ